MSNQKWFKITILGNEIQKRIQVWKKLNNRVHVCKSIRLADSVSKKIMVRRSK